MWAILDDDEFYRISECEACLDKQYRKLDACKVKGCVVVQTPPVRTSAQVMTRFRRWFRCPPRCQRALYSRNFACLLLETPGHRHTLQTRRHHWRRAPDHRSLTRNHSRRALGVWRRPLGILQRPSWEFVRDKPLHKTHETSKSR